MNTLNKKIKSFKGFTLVELLVVIAILAILGTIAFLSFGGFSSKARDGSRISDTASLSKGLELYQVQSGKYPIPEQITGTGIIGITTVAYKGEIQDQISTLTKISKTPRDPLSNNYYIYGTTADYKQYQIATTLENSLSLRERAGVRVYADSPTYSARVTGNYKGLIKYSSGATETRIANIPSLIYSTGNLLSTTNLYSINKSTNLPYPIKDSTPGTQTPSDILLQLTGTAATLTGINITPITKDNISTYSTTLATLGYDLSLVTQTILGTATTSSTPTYLDCTFNETPVPHSTSVTAYLTTSVPFGNTCTSEQRTCNNGTLSGTYTNSTCITDGATGTFNLSATSVIQGTNVTISNNCSTPPTSYTSSNTAVATIAGTTITTLSAGTTNITPVGGACADIVAKSLTVNSQQWTNIDSICTKPDITIGSITVAGCNSTIGSLAINYNNSSTSCYDYAGAVITCTAPPSGKTTSTMTEVDYKAGQSTNIYGALYQYDQMSSSTCLGTGISSSNTTCPCKSGRHVPSDTEWNNLETALGCNETSLTGRRCMTATADTTNGLGWTSTNSNSLKNKLGLTLGGYCSGGTCGSRGHSASYWSSTLFGSTSSRSRSMNYSVAAVYRDSYTTTYGFSVRCFKD